MTLKKITKNPDIWMFTVVLIWGLNTPTMKQIITTIDQWTFVGLRFIAISILSLSSFYLLQKKRDLLNITKVDLLKVIAASLCAFGFYQYFLMHGLSQTPVFLATILVGFSPLFAILISYFLRLETYTWKVFVGVFIALFGVLLFKFEGADSFTFGQSFSGELFCLGSGLSWAAYTVIMKSESLKKYPREQINTLSMLIGTIIVLSYSYNEVLSFDYSVIEPNLWYLIVYTMVFPIFLAYKMYNASIQRVGVERTVLFIYLVPIVSGGISIGLGMESFTLMKLLGAGVVILGMILARKG